MKSVKELKGLVKEAKEELTVVGITVSESTMQIFVNDSQDNTVYEGLAELSCWEDGFESIDGFVDFIITTLYGDNNLLEIIVHDHQLNGVYGLRMDDDGNYYESGSRKGFSKQIEELLERKTTTEITQIMTPEEAEAEMRIKRNSMKAEDDCRMSFSGNLLVFCISCTMFLLFPVVMAVLTIILALGATLIKLKGWDK